jgi:hypothetical protein
MFICTENLYPSSKLLCVVCKLGFEHPWDLMVHAQAAHMVNIYEIGESDEEDDSNTNNSGNKLDKANGESQHSSVNGLHSRNEIVSPCLIFNLFMFSLE